MPKMEIIEGNDLNFSQNFHHRWRKLSISNLWNAPDLRDSSTDVETFQIPKILNFYFLECPRFQVGKKVSAPFLNQPTFLRKPRPSSPQYVISQTLYVLLALPVGPLMSSQWISYLGYRLLSWRSMTDLRFKTGGPANPDAPLYPYHWSLRLAYKGLRVCSNSPYR